MEKYLRYTGEFLSRAGVAWRVEILQDADRPFSRIGSLEFEAEEALVIEWGETGKEEVLCGSTATLRLESPGDRTYEDLYTIAPGRIRMDVYREGALYWSGTLDPEFYEEPYERAANYPVSLTFSDFGVLDRLKYDMAGMRTIYELVGHCIGRSGINTILDEGLISTALAPDGVGMSLADLKMRSDNFYDEDGEPLTLKEVLEGVLQPLALRMVQRCGRIHVYDLNALYHAAPSQPVVWDGDSQTMGADRVFNNAKITWNTYAQSGNLALTDCWDEDIKTDPNQHALLMLQGKKVGDSTLFSYHYSTRKGSWRDLSDVGFTIWLNDKGNNAEITNPSAKFYKIVPQIDGQESEGVALRWPGVSFVSYSGGGYDYSKIVWRLYGIGDISGTSKQTGGTVFRTAPVDIPPVDEPRRLLVRVTLEMLLDPRFNPFESAVKWADAQDQADWEKKWNLRGNFVYVPVTIKFQPDNSTDVYCWTNQHIVSMDVSNESSQIDVLAATYGNWVKSTPDVWGYLAYYSTEDRGEKSGVVGWQKNRPAINPHTGRLTSSLANAEDGQYIPYPKFGTGGGKLWVEVHSGWVLSDGGGNLVVENIFDSYGLWKDKYNWVLCQLPEVEILNSLQFENAINTDDVEYSGEINAEAKEDIELDTICGSSKDGVPTARGAYFSTASGNQITELSRAGRTSQIEDLLIGTLFSQFGQRRTKLSGEMKIASGTLGTYTEANQEGKKFMLTADIQDVITDTSDATLCELRPDEYERRD